MFTRVLITAASVTAIFLCPQMHGFHLQAERAA